ncbi:SigE family RNA polymerase sigma factor [Streptomyces sp. HUAS TT20]|uniref:SigE family RNA polymerase sigma factor n=1 Tax=Streptomyces sp. HUAS TT20 TaxID=3447509 RepID=UPI0021DB6D46|nr:SigE family RNA polymerase sigma factor [Streptomyces sp. HUAS 15-9]UXY25130.1 SigE family RNA polymerase sigma factor [Streptomyces sp. HUAS 15-9]
MTDHPRETDFRTWVLEHRTRLRTTAFLLCGDWYLADDLVQDALGRLYSRWDKVVASGDPRAYVRRILCNLHTDYRRRPARREISEADVATLHAHPHTRIEERDDDLIAALLTIPAGQRTVLVLRFFEDLSIEQTAALLKTSPGNVKSQTSRGLDALRSALRTHPTKNIRPTRIEGAS